MLSAKASISSVDDCVTCGRAVATKGSGEFRAEWAVVSEPGPDDCEEELEPFLEDLVERAPLRKREARTIVGESLGNHGLRHAQQYGVVHVAQAKWAQAAQRSFKRAGAV